MEDEIQRDYHGPDYYLLEQSQTLKDLLDDDLADFTAFDLEYTAAFVLAWQAAIDAAVDYTDDNVVAAQILAQSEDVETRMQACKDKYSDIIYFAGKAFGKNGVKLREFGRGPAFRQAGFTQERMFGFMDELSATAIKYTAELQAEGCPPAAITGIATVRDALNTSNREQNLSIVGRPVISQGRVIVYNALYKITRQTIDAAQRVYRTNPAKRAQYQYNPPINEEENTIVRQITVGAGLIGNLSLEGIAGPELDAPDLIEFEAIGSDAKYFASETVDGPPGAGPFLIVLSGQKIPKTHEEMLIALGFSSAKSFMNVQNTGAVVGTYRVTFHY